MLWKGPQNGFTVVDGTRERAHFLSARAMPAFATMATKKLNQGFPREEIMRWIVWWVAMLAAPAALADSIGVFTVVQGEVRIQRDDGYYTAAQGVEVQQSDIVETGAESNTQVELNDGTVLQLGSDSRLLLSDYQLDQDQSVLHAGVEVLTGWLRFAVAKLHGDDRRFEIGTPTMTIGIRGTEGVIDASNEQGGLDLEEGRVAVRAVNDSSSGSPSAAGGETVEAGQYIERRRGQAFMRPAAAPASFHARMPAFLRARAVRRAHLLHQRGVPPQFVRQLQREDRERYLREHPYMRQHFERRFHEHARDVGRPADASNHSARTLTPREKQEWQQRRREELKRREELRRHRREQENSSGLGPASPPVADVISAIA